MVIIKNPQANCTLCSPGPIGPHAMSFVLDIGISNNSKALVEICLASIVIICYNPGRLTIVFNGPTMVCDFKFFAASGKTLPSGLTVSVSVWCVVSHGAGFGLSGESWYASLFVLS